MRNSKFPKDYRGIFQHDNGSLLTPQEAREELFDRIAKGQHVMPLSPECGGPCMHADKGCVGFNYGEGGGCPGYTIPEAAEAAS
ncbi:hypothetical protein [Nevskia ramosa]|uniref:hypothetical protein n=1 Tax=Nevskia ramosa TaxID=64002 RepID=UPI003D0A7710